MWYVLFSYKYYNFTYSSQSRPTLAIQIQTWQSWKKLLFICNPVLGREANEYKLITFFLPVFFIIINMLPGWHGKKNSTSMIYNLITTIAVCLLYIFNNLNSKIENKSVYRLFKVIYRIFIAIKKYRSLLKFVKKWEIC